MIMYGDITPWRCARMMRVAEEEAAAGRMTLMLTENDSTTHLALQGFLIYRPASVGFNPTDIAVIIARLLTGRNVVINTNELGDDEKQALSRLLVAALSRIDISRLSLIVESTEQFFPRRWNYGHKTGMPTLNNLLKRAKAVGAHMCFAAESPSSIAIEISESCGTPAVGRLSNNSRAQAVSKVVDNRIGRNMNEIWGVKVLNPEDFFLFNSTTAPRQADPQGVLPIDTPVDMGALARLCIIPFRLNDVDLDCGFDPRNPTPGPKPGSKAQTDFEDALDQAREEAGDEQPEPAPAIAARATSPRPVATRTGTVANDNGVGATRKVAAPKPRAKAKVKTRFTGAQTSVALLRAEGIVNADRMVALGIKVVNSRGGRLNVPLNGRITPRGLANKLIGEPILREAILAGFMLSHRHRNDPSTVINATAYGACYYQALQEDEALARRFHAEMFVDGFRSGRVSQQGRDLQMALRQIGMEEDGSVRSEAQYQLLRNAWGLFAHVNRGSLPKAA